MPATLLKIFIPMQFTSPEANKVGDLHPDKPRNDQRILTIG